MEHRIAAAGAVEPGAARAFTVDGTEVLVCNVGDTLFAIEDVCTHDGAPLDQGELDGRCIVCPRHGARFDVETGAALTLPAIEPVRTYAIRRDGDDAWIDIA